MIQNRRAFVSASCFWCLVYLRRPHFLTGCHGNGSQLGTDFWRLWQQRLGEGRGREQLGKREGGVSSRAPPPPSSPFRRVPARPRASPCVPLAAPSARAYRRPATRLRSLSRASTPNVRFPELPGFSLRRSQASLPRPLREYPRRAVPVLSPVQAERGRGPRRWQNQQKS